MIDVFHFYWIIIFALAIGIVGGEIIADLSNGSSYKKEHPPNDKKESSEKEEKP